MGGNATKASAKNGSRRRAAAVPKHRKAVALQTVSAMYWQHACAAPFQGWELAGRKRPAIPRSRVFFASQPSKRGTPVNSVRLHAYAGPAAIESARLTIITYRLVYRGSKANEPATRARQVGVRGPGADTRRAFAYTETLTSGMGEQRLRSEREARQPDGRGMTNAENQTKPNRRSDRQTVQSRRVVAIGVAMLLVCLLSALALVTQHFGGLHLPGCGAGSSCAEVTASAWGRVPYIEWPVAYVGFAYFLGLLVTWCVQRGGTSPGLRWLIRLGVLASVGLTGIMFAEGHVCPYCLATHIGNVLFWLLIEATRARSLEGNLRSFATVGSVFLLSSAMLAATDWRQRVIVTAQAEEDLQISTTEIIAASSQRAAATEPKPLLNVAATEPDAGGEADKAGPIPEPATRGFTGRYRLGPERAAIRVVMFTDYQCKECKRIEADVIALVRARNDMSVSFKQYPMNPDCNRIAKQRRHPNACWAARAAEAAGILRGADAFWQMHFWLFEQGGGFTKEELNAALQRFGYDPAEFVETMTSDETLERVKADVEEAVSLGIWYTPTVYINGVELRGWNAPQAIPRAVERLAATNPPALTAAADHPAVAMEKLVGDWQAQPRREVPAGKPYRRSGNAAAPLRVVVFGDYHQPGAANAHGAILEAMEQGVDVCYEYRHFPFNKDCNPAVKVDSNFENSCRAAKVGEAAGRLGGAEAYWKMHTWLLGSAASFSDRTIGEAAATAGLDPAALLAETAKPEVEAAVAEDVRLAMRIGATNVPTVFINGRRVPRWELNGEIVLGDLIAAVAEKR